MSTKLNTTKEMTSGEVIRATMPPSKWIEVRQRQNGSYTVHYPDPGFIPCAPVCDLKKNVRGHKCDFEQQWIETNYKPTSLEDAVAWAEYLADGREVKVVPFIPIQERRRKAVAQEGVDSDE